MKSIKAILLLIIVVFFYSCAPLKSESLPEAGTDSTAVSSPDQTGQIAPAPTPNPVPAPTPTYTGPISDFKLTCEEARFVELLNKYRLQNNLGIVAVSQAGVTSARWHTQDMIDQNYFSHTEPSGRGFSQRAFSFGYSARAENIAAGNSTAERTFCQWKNSSGHNLNMLGAQHKTIGLGRSSGGGDYGVYWENIFGPSAADTLSSPLTTDVGCQMPQLLPAC